MPLSLAIDRTTPVSPWTQLRDGVVRAIERGRLHPGERLPTVRGLAAELDLAPNTVARAYRALEDEGWLVGRGRTGTFVADAPPTDPAILLRRAAETYLRQARHLGFDEDAARRALRS